MMRHHIYKSHDPKRRLSLMIPQEPVPDQRRRCSVNDSSLLLPPALSTRRSSHGDISPVIIPGERKCESEFKFNEHRKLSSAFVNDTHRQSLTPTDPTSGVRRRSSIYTGDLKRLEQETEESSSTVRNFVSVVIVVISIVIGFSFYQLVYG